MKYKLKLRLRFAAFTLALVSHALAEVPDRPPAMKPSDHDASTNGSQPKPHPEGLPDGKTLFQVPPKLEPNSSFMIGGDNTDEDIRNLKTLTGQSIETLEKLMRPSRPTLGDLEGSDAGYIGVHENLKEVLAKDNACVHAMGTTHQALARKLNAVLINGDPTGTLKIQVVSTFISPFPTVFGTNEPSEDIKITNTKTGKVIVVAGAHPDFIFNYGLYEGRGTIFRADPADLAEVLGVGKNHDAPECFHLQDELTGLKEIAGRELDLDRPKDNTTHPGYSDLLEVNLKNRLSRVIKKSPGSLDEILATLEPLIRKLRPGVRGNPFAFLGPLEAIAPEIKARLKDGNGKSLEPYLPIIRERLNTFEQAYRDWSKQTGTYAQDLTKGRYDRIKQLQSLLGP